MLKLKYRLGDFKVTDEQRNIVNEILDRGRITEGEYTRKFESKIAKYIGTKYSVACNSGTSALMLASSGLFYDKQKNNSTLNCLVPATTFPATANAMLNTKFNVDLIDVKDDYLIDCDKLRDHIEKNNSNIHTVIPVHLFGYIADMARINKYKKKYGFKVIEDACESVGSSINGMKAGSFGDVACLSLFVGHQIGVGELGIVTTNNKEIYERMMSLKNHGRTGSNMEFRHSYIGYNFKTIEFMSGMALSMIKDFDKIIKKRQNVAKFFNDNIQTKDRFTLPRFDKGCGYLGYPIMTKSIKDKKYIVNKLNLAGIETRGMFPCLKNQVSFKGMFLSKDDYPVADRLESLGFYIGCHQYYTEEDLSNIVKVFNEL